MKDKSISFWCWFVKGTGGKPGYKRVVNSWLIIHIIIGIALAMFVPLKLVDAASTILLPMMGIFIGLSFAWVGNAQSLLQSKEIEELSEYHEGGFTDYVFIFQNAILVILATVVLWGLAGLHIFDETWPRPQCLWYNIVKAILYTFSSITLRECWHVVLGPQWMLLVQRRIKQMRDEEENENK